MEAKDRYENKILEYLGNPENEFPNREGLASAIGCAKQTLYKHFSPEALTILENKGLELRRQRLGKIGAKIDKALIKQAESGDTAAARLYYERLEGWSNKHIQKVELDEPIVLQWAKEPDKESD